MAGWLRTVVAGLMMLVLTSGCSDAESGEAGYGAELQDEFLTECRDNGTAEPVCTCLYESLEATVPYTRFETLDEALRADSTAIPAEVEALAVACAAEPDRARGPDPAASSSDR